MVGDRSGCFRLNVERPLGDMTSGSAVIRSAWSSEWIRWSFAGVKPLQLGPAKGDSNRNGDSWKHRNISAMKCTRSPRSAQSTAPDPAGCLVSDRSDQADRGARGGRSAEVRAETAAEILAELKADGPELDGHQVASQDVSDEPMLLDDERVDGDIEQRASPDQSGDQ